MIKTIKVKKQFRLDELIKYIRDNRVREKTFRTNEHGNALKVDEDGLIETYFPTMHINNSFTVEEEVTEDTELFGVQEVCLDKEKEEIGVEYWPDGSSINDVLNHYNCSIECLQLYAKVNGKLQLVWEAE